MDVLRDVDLDIREGEFVVLLGPSGCGKSTLLRIIAGLEDLSAGEVEIAGRVVNDVEPKDRSVAMVFQSFALYPHMTVRRNLSFGLTMKAVPKPAIASRVAEASKILDIQDLLERYPHQISGGQRQRVAMGRAIVRDPEVFLFDEPLSNLDARLRLLLRLEIKKLHQRLGNTVVYVTHDQVEAMTMADRVVVMRDGRIEQIGTPVEVYDQPANVFVAEFIGSPPMNLITGTTDGRGRIRTRSGALLPVPSDVAAAPDGHAVVYGVRPEDFAITGEPDPASSFAATVALVEPLGRETLVYCDVGDDQICVAPGKRSTVVAGETIHLAPLPAKACLFDLETSRRL
jgi:multiple sugar transport system ATP-binding protein